MATKTVQQQQIVISAPNVAPATLEDRAARFQRFSKKCGDYEETGGGKQQAKRAARARDFG